MKTNSVNIKNILLEYDKIRSSNMQLEVARKEEIYKLSPKIISIDETITNTSLNAIKERLSGKTIDKKAISYNNRKLSEEKKEILLKNGYPSDYLDPIYNCKACKDTGFIDNKKCACLTQRIIDSLYQQANVKELLLTENFSTFSLEYYEKDKNNMDYSPYENMSNVIAKSKDFINNFDDKKGNILIYGETGLGKTFLTNCIAKELLDRGNTVLYLSANELFTDILSNYIMNNKKDEDIASTYNYLYSCELLIIDDLGTELTNSFVQSQLFEIINKRAKSKLSTLISSNLNIKQLRDRYTERIASRIIADYIVFFIYGDNIRYQKRKNKLTF